MKNENMDKLKNIILLYANAEGLDDIKNGLFSEDYIDRDWPDDPTPFPVREELKPLTNYYAWDYHGTDKKDVYYHLKAISLLRDMGLVKAQEAINALDHNDELIMDVFEFVDSYPPAKKNQEQICKDAFYDIFGYSVERSCPCSFHKMQIFAEKGTAQANEDLDKATWIKKPENCLECERAYFVAILEKVTQGHFQHLSGIVEKYNKTYVETVEFWNEKQPFKKIMSFDYIENTAAFPRYLKGLPCNILVDYLSSVDSQKIKRCVICEKFFFAKDAKRTMTCYEEECIKKLLIHEKTYQREKDPVKYGSSKPKEDNVDEYNRFKAIREGNAKKK